MTRITLAIALVAIVAVAPGSLRSQTQADRPNVILIMTDDAGYADFGSYGATDIKTPHIDSLATDGVRLTDFYANGATCTPTRAGLISGRYQQRFVLERPLSSAASPDGRLGLPATGHSLPQLLKNHGYRTALIGKWHLGYLPAFSPRAHGFEHFFGFKSGYVDFYQHRDGLGHPDLFEDDETTTATGYLTDLITDRSVRFITDNRQQPFFLDVAYNAPHWPYQVPDHPSTAPNNARHVGPFDTPTSTRADYIAMLQRVDAGVGRILATLDKLDLRRSTLVIFTNDNGGEWLTNAGPLFHHKGSVWEGGIRVPAIARWPGRIKAGTVSGQVGLTMDLTASILAATRALVPADARLDGIDLLPVLEGRVPEIERTLFWRVPAQRAVRAGEWKLIFDGGRPLLFNIRADVGERRNLIGQRPEIARRLRSLLDAWQADVDGEAKKTVAQQ